MTTSTLINQLMRKRRSVFPNAYKSGEIPEDVLGEILENANWAPTHRLTEPWRFRVFRNEALGRLGDYLAEWYKAHTPEKEFSELKYEKNRKNPRKAAVVIAICMQRDPEASVPEWEEIAAVACAVQNMWLTCTANGIGAYWSTPKAILEAHDFLQLGEGERCLGLFYMGYTDQPEAPGKRRPLAEKVIWLE